MNINKIKQITVHIDIIDQLLTEMVGDEKQAMKKLINTALNHVRKLVRRFDKVMDKESQINFGIIADDIRAHIDNKYFNDEN